MRPRGRIRVRDIAAAKSEDVAARDVEMEVLLIIGINSAGTMYLKGGYVYSHSTNNDAIDSNGDLIVSGGTIVAYGASDPDVLALGAAIYIPESLISLLATG